METPFKIRDVLEIRSDGSPSPRRPSLEPLQLQLLPVHSQVLTPAPVFHRTRSSIQATDPLLSLQGRLEAADRHADAEDTFFIDILVPSVIPHFEHQLRQQLLVCHFPSHSPVLLLLPAVLSSSLPKQSQHPQCCALSQRETVSHAVGLLLSQDWCMKS